MEKIFEALLTISLSGSIVILLVMVLRLLLKNAPKRLVCLLWLLVGIRLLLPVHIETKFSLQPDFEQVLPQPKIQQGVISEDIVPAAPNPGNNVVISTEDAVTIEVQRSINWVSVAAVVWMLGAAIMLLYTAVSYIRLNRQVRGAVQTEEGVWESGNVDGAFLFGYLKPRIFLPAGLTGCDREYVLSHERTHIACGDHWTKLVGFLCLSMHWFNPLVWIAYRLLCRDLEMACDEQVVRRYSLEERKAYSNALLSCSVGSRPVSACPIAFGEVDVKERIMKILNYRKPAFWICVLCVFAVIGTAVFFLTDAAPQYDTVFEEYASMIGLHKDEFLKEVDLGEGVQPNAYSMYYFPETVTFNGNEFVVSYYHDEMFKNRVTGVSFGTAYQDMENFAEDYITIQNLLVEIYGDPRNRTDLFSDAEEILAQYTPGEIKRGRNIGLHWDKNDCAPYPATQELMQEIVTWDSMIEFVKAYYGNYYEPKTSFHVALSSRVDEEHIQIEVEFRVALDGRKKS